MKNSLKNLLENLDSVKKPKAILLDWDNTLADSWVIIHKCLNQAFIGLGREPWSLEDVMGNREGIHHALRESFPRIFGDDWEKAKEVYFSHFLKCHIQEISLLPGAMDTIKGLTEIEDCFIGIVSNKTGPYLRNELDHLEISKYFDVIIGATDAERDKPFKEPLLLALKDSGVSIEKNSDEIWMVGDSNTDIEAAINTGVIPVLYGDANIAQYNHQAEIYQVRSQPEFQLITDKLKQ